jgi:hypothetical protein
MYSISDRIDLGRNHGHTDPNRPLQRYDHKTHAGDAEIYG